MNLLLLCFLGIVSLIALNIEAIQNGYDGKEDLPTQFPYLTLIILTYIPVNATEAVTIYGAGILVDLSLVLTSARLLSGVKDGTSVNITVSVGLYDPAQITSNPNTFTGLDQNSIIFNPEKGSNSALIRLPRDVTDMPVAILVKPGDNIARNECYVAGYGALIPNGAYPNPAQIAPQPLLCKPGEREKCLARNNAILKEVNPDTTYNFCRYADSRLCAGYFQSAAYIGPCTSGTYITPFNGDIGDPLQCNLVTNQGQKANQVVVGFSLGDSCIEDASLGLLPPDRVPNTYNSVIKLISFIDENRLSECDRFFGANHEKS